MNLKHLSIEINDYESDKQIFDFLVHFMQPRKNIIKDLRRSLIL